MDLNMALLASVEVKSYIFAIILVCAGCFTQALGIVLELKPNVAMLSPEGVVKYSSRRWRRNFGHLKVAFDISLVTTAAILSFIMAGHIEGLRGDCCGCNLYRIDSLFDGEIHFHAQTNTQYSLHTLWF